MTEERMKYLLGRTIGGLYEVASDDMEVRDVDNYLTKVVGFTKDELHDFNIYVDDETPAIHRFKVHVTPVRFDLELDKKGVDYDFDGMGRYMVKESELEDFLEVADLLDLDYEEI